jgi:hypothetical protein
MSNNDSRLGLVKTRTAAALNKRDISNSVFTTTGKYLVNNMKIFGQTEHIQVDSAMRRPGRKMY